MLLIVMMEMNEQLMICMDEESVADAAANGGGWHLSLSMPICLCIENKTILYYS